MPRCRISALVALWGKDWKRAGRVVGLLRTWFVGWSGRGGARVKGERLGEVRKKEGIVCLLCSALLQLVFCTPYSRLCFNIYQVVLSEKLQQLA